MSLFLVFVAPFLIITLFGKKGRRKVNVYRIVYCVNKATNRFNPFKNLESLNSSINNFMKFKNVDRRMLGLWKRQWVGRTVVEASDIQRFQLLRSYVNLAPTRKP